MRIVFSSKGLRFNAGRSLNGAYVGRKAQLFWSNGIRKDIKTQFENVHGLFTDPMKVDISARLC